MLAFAAIGCSSSDDGNNSNPQFKWDGGANNGGGGNYVPPATCGNNQVDAMEECDGVATLQCSQATMGSRPIGTVTCNGCRYDSSGCTSNNPNPGAGGGLGAGGNSSAGGGLNLGGSGNTPNGGTGVGGGLAGGGTNPSHLPTVNGTCPNLQTGNVTVNGAGQPMTWQIWMGANNTSGNGGPIVIYWHATGGHSTEAQTGLGAAAIAEIQAMGGIVASPEATSMAGTNTGNGVWYTGDFDYADQVIACAMQKNHLDARHIHSAGYSAGGLQTVAYWAARSGYVASVMSYSGGAIGNPALQDPAHVPPGIAAHGRAVPAGAQPNTLTDDWVVIDFNAASKSWESNIRGKGGFVIDCDDGGSHIDVGKRMAIAPQGWQFFKDHPYGASPEPYTSLPPGWPSYCSIVP